MSSQARESTRLVEFLAWVEVNKKKLLIGAAIVAATIAGQGIYQWHSGQAEAEANAALLKLDGPSARLENAPEPNAQAFLQVAAAHRGTAAAGRALLLGAEALFREGKFAEAKTQFDNFQRDYAENPLAPTAALGAAICLDAMDKTNEALVAYQDVVSRFVGSPVVAQAKLGLARLYETRNEPVQALKTYDDLTRPSAPSVWSSEAAMRRAQLLSQHPELAKTNAPAGPSLLSNAPPTTELTTTNNPANDK